MSGDNSDQKYRAGTRLIFAHARTGDVIKASSENAFTPIPREGESITIQDAEATVSEEGDNWDIENRGSVALVVTDIEYSYNYVTFEREGERGVRLLTDVWVFGEPKQSAEDLQ